MTFEVIQPACGKSDEGCISGILIKWDMRKGIAYVSGRK